MFTLYNKRHRIIALLLFIAILLESCGNPLPTIAPTVVQSTEGEVGTQQRLGLDGVANAKQTHQESEEDSEQEEYTESEIEEDGNSEQEEVEEETISSYTTLITTYQSARKDEVFEFPSAMPADIYQLDQRDKEISERKKIPSYKSPIHIDFSKERFGKGKAMSSYIIPIEIRGPHESDEEAEKEVKDGSTEPNEREQEQLTSDQGKKYCLLHTIDRITAASIHQATGLEIDFQLGQQIHKNFILGEGSFGKVYLAQQEDGTYVAIKIVPEEKIKEKEAEIQQVLSQLPHLMSALDTWKGKNKDNQVTFYQVMPLAVLGDLRNIDLSQVDTIFKEQVLTFLSSRMLTGLATMHEKGYLHGDLKPSNVMLEQDVNLRIIDFGCSEAFTGLYQTKVKDMYPDNISPEYFLSVLGYIDEQFHDPRKFDSWSVGLTLLYLANKKYKKRYNRPFYYKTVAKSCRSYKDYEDIIQKVSELANPAAGSIWELIRALLTPDPQERPTPEEALAYTCFKQTLPSSVQTYLKDLIQHQQVEKRIKKYKVHIPRLLPLSNFAKYISRPELENQLLASLLTPSNNMTVCQGSGGVGKSELANYIIYHKDIQAHFNKIYWFSSADNPNQLQEQFRLLAIDLNLIDRGANFVEAKEALLKYWKEKKSRVLLIFDNADEPKSLNAYLPIEEDVHVLITTREPSWSNPIKIGSLDVIQGRALVNKLLGCSNTDANKLAKFLGYLPLSITYACAYIRREQVSVDKFLKKLSKNSNILTQNPKLFGQELPHSIATLWQATFKKLEERCPLALRVLESLTFCEPEGIPYELLEGLFNELDPSATSEVRQILIDYELLQEREMQQDGEVYKYLSMHRLLQQVVQQAAGKEYLNSCESTSILGQKSLNPLIQVLHKCIPNAKPVPDKNWEQARLYVPHVVSILAKTGGNLEESIVLAELLDCMGSYSEKVQSNYPQALKYYRQAHAINRILYIDNHPARAASLNHLASAHRGLGKHKAALTYLEKALAIELALYPDNHSHIAKSLNNIGLIYRDLGQYKESLKSFEQALAMKHLTYPNNHPTIAASLNNIGTVYKSLRKYEEALKYYKLALAIKKANYPDNHPSMAASLNNLGSVYENLNQPEEAFEYYVQAFIINQEFYTDNHPNTAHTLNGIGSTYRALGRYREALKYYKQALTINQRFYTHNHPNIAYTMNGIGSTYRALVEYGEALKYCE
ncbi:hypothetical protein Aasi_0820 [Candidatus Amoebophilus asiaticus 5a2]|uniref:Protein kinase domain-containing protein n=1 Tax=Amoebophilus asiaticus (strain 5a2) TaxID=452471 RepID=B3ESJ1_AMOA5|nr:tetratricopeptide repeat-containing protein kinase family protein [Candidatus Amoebophilus asiaticus]ACE06193.1 hypothetical protein Aasi_0820 [Candidatus Amoebophilus asiaticus 5a2]